MTLIDRLQADLREALKAKNEVRVSTLRFLLAALQNLKIEKGSDLAEEDVVSVIQKQIKQRKESIEGFEKGGREDLVAKEKAEMAILEEYLPEQLADADIDKLVDEAIKNTSSSGVQDIGKVMAKLSVDLKGKADMSTVSRIVREKLS